MKVHGVSADALDALARELVKTARHASEELGEVRREVEALRVQVEVFQGAAADARAEVTELRSRLDALRAELEGER